MARRATRRRLVGIAIALAGSALLGACGGDAGTDAGASTTAAAPSSPAGDAATSAKLPPELAWSTARLDGNGDIQGGSYAGRPTAFWFWAPG